MSRLLISILFSVACVLSFDPKLIGGFDGLNHQKLFLSWKAKYQKKYSSVEEEAKKFDVFISNARKINKWNNKPKANYTLGLNDFADLTSDEFRMQVHGHMGSCLLNRDRDNVQTYNPRLGKINLPSSVDWSQHSPSVVTPVKNQGQCGSCWAFSTTGSIESRTAIKTGRLVSLSEQQLVDCSGRYGNQGCNGGLMDNAFQYVRATGGLCTESAYPYRASDGSCKASSCGRKYDDISGYVDVSHQNPQALMAAVAEGPVSIAIEADQFSFQNYNGGVLSGSCGTRLDHGVLIVGYGTMSGQKYWKVKNSWGSRWGMQGYILICRECNKNGRQGECGILDQPSYPTV